MPAAKAVVGTHEAKAVSHEDADRRLALEQRRLQKTPQFAVSLPGIQKQRAPPEPKEHADYDASSEVHSPLAREG